MTTPNFTVVKGYAYGNEGRTEVQYILRINNPAWNKRIRDQRIASNKLRLAKKAYADEYGMFIRKLFAAINAEDSTLHNCWNFDLKPGLKDKSVYFLSAKNH